MKQIKLFLCLPYNKHLINLGRVYRPHCVRSVLTTSVKILPYRPPARLIRAKYYPRESFILLVGNGLYVISSDNDLNILIFCVNVSG